MGYVLLCGLWVWRRRTNRRPCCPPMSNPSTSPWTAWHDGSGWWDNWMAAQHLPRDLLWPSSRQQKTRSNDDEDLTLVCNAHYLPTFPSWSNIYDLFMSSDLGEYFLRCWQGCGVGFFGVESDSWQPWESESDFLSDSGCSVGTFLRHTLKLGIPVEMVQFLLKLLLKQSSCCAPRFTLILTTNFHFLYVKESEILERSELDILPPAPQPWLLTLILQTLTFCDMSCSACAPEFRGRPGCTGHRLTWNQYNLQNHGPLAVLKRDPNLLSKLV